MSKYAELKTEMREQCHLAAALRSLGFTIETHATPQALYGYRDDVRPERADVIIRRQHTGDRASNDVGFVRGADGSYRAIISDYDGRHKFCNAWLGQVKQAYTEQRTLAVAKSKGYVFRGREVVDGKVKLLFAVR